MYAGRIMESGTAADLFESPSHPYTEGLLKAVPRLDQIEKRRRLYIIRGIVPSLLELPSGCKFNDRCEKSFSRCVEEEPPLFEVGPEHGSRCWLYERV